MLQEFKYFAPPDIEDLLDLLKKHGKKARLLAGGTDIIADIRVRIAKPDFMIDTKKIEVLKLITYKKSQGLFIGSAVTCIELIKNNIIKKYYPMLVSAAAHIGSPQLRNRATIVGNVCTASPCADMPPSLLALDASVEIRSCDKIRMIKLSDFFTGVKRTALTEGEMVFGLHIPPGMENAKGGYEKLKRIKGHDLAVASVAVSEINGDLRVAVGSCARTPVLLPVFKSTTSLKKIKETAEECISPIDDVRASKDYRLFMVIEYIERLVKRVRAKGDSK